MFYVTSYQIAEYDLYLRTPLAIENEKGDLHRAN